MSEQERRAIGTSIESSRRANGQSLEASRRAIGSSIESQRTGTTGRQIVDDLNRLVETSSASRTVLPTLEKRGGISSVKGVGTFNEKNVPKSSGGIASPVSETDYTKREYWEDSLMSSDGLFSMPVLKMLEMTDNDGATVIFNFAKPITPTGAT